MSKIYFSMQDAALSSGIIHTPYHELPTLHGMAATAVYTPMNNQSNNYRI
ncbi:MAG: hypothetical protein K2K22_01560 [Muribaculaceae bacterium]|nr:hypothetical protein [Muribaculaceae bacterium]